MTNNTLRSHQITEYAVGGKSLGRHVLHDSRSRAYPVQVDVATRPKSVEWERGIPVLIQGDIGSCTGNAEVGMLGTEPFVSDMRELFPHLSLDEAEALVIYSDATRIDRYPGTFSYPPPGGTDTGSNGLSVMKVAKKAGYISGYRHAFSFTGVLHALQKTPGITGIDWYDSFDDPGSDGIVSLPASARVRGGHEVELAGVEMEAELIVCWNSWGSDWGKGGKFYIPFAVYRQLLANDGDATFGVPLTYPAPQAVDIA